MRDLDRQKKCILGETHCMNTEQQAVTLKFEQSYNDQILQGADIELSLSTT